MSNASHPHRAPQQTNSATIPDTTAHGRDDVRAARGAAPPIAADATIAGHNASRYYHER